MLHTPVSVALECLWSSVELKSPSNEQDGPDKGLLGHEEPQRGPPYAERKSLDQWTGLLFCGKREFQEHSRCHNLTCSSQTGCTGETAVFEKQ